MCSFDLHYDLKSTEALETFIEQFQSPKAVMMLMFEEIRIRDKKIESLEEDNKMLDIVIAAHNDLITEFIKKKEITEAIEHITSLPDREPDRSKDHYVFAPDGAPASFCRFCGAGIPHRPGEGRCVACMHHLDEEDTTADADQALADVVAMDADSEIRYRNHYNCPCGNEWWDSWSSECDDDCPSCGTTCSPS